VHWRSARPPIGIKKTAASTKPTHYLNQGVTGTLDMHSRILTYQCAR